MVFKYIYKITMAMLTIALLTTTAYAEETLEEKKSPNKPKKLEIYDFEKIYIGIGHSVGGNEKNVSGKKTPIYFLGLRTRKKQNVANYLEFVSVPVEVPIVSAFSDNIVNIHDGNYSIIRSLSKNSFGGRWRSLGAIGIGMLSLEVPKKIVFRNERYYGIRKISLKNYYLDVLTGWEYVTDTIILRADLSASLSTNKYYRFFGSGMLTAIVKF